MLRKLFITIICSLAISVINANTIPVLKVCTAGDYAPLTSYNTQTQTFSGVAINEVNAFAKSQGYKIIWVKTTWSKLSSDLKNNKCFMAVGGISLTKDRKDIFFVSVPTGASAKVPLALCTNKDKFDSFKKINNPNVSLIENKGGTNEKIAKQKAPNAKITIIQNNENIFDLLQKGSYDVMITDSIEASYWENKTKDSDNPLCQTMSINQAGDISYKVFLFTGKTSSEHSKVYQNGLKFKKEFDQWWLQEKGKFPSY